MSDSKQAPESAAGDSVSVTIGDHAKQVAAGKNVIQTIDPRADPVGANPSAASRKAGPNLALKAILAAVLALATNLLASYLEQEHQLLSSQVRLSAVALVFVGSLGLSIWLAGRGST